MQVILSTDRTEFADAEHPRRCVGPGEFMYQFGVVSRPTEEVLAPAAAREGERRSSGLVGEERDEVF